MDAATNVEGDSAGHSIFEDFVNELKGSLGPNVESVKKAKKNPAKRKRKEDKKKRGTETEFDQEDYPHPSCY